MSRPVQARAEKPSLKPLVAVGALLMLAATGAALTTRGAAPPAPRPPAPVQVVVTQLDRPASKGGEGSAHAQAGDRLSPRPERTSWA